MIDQFPKSVKEHLGHYVYIYVDPLDDSIFYVGKGIGNRAFDHLSDMKSAAYQRIGEIRSRGQEPLIEVLVHGLGQDREAAKVEAAVIDLLGVRNLTNRVRGLEASNFGRMKVEDICNLYDPRKVDIVEPALLIRINRLFRYSMSSMELYDVTRGVWRIGVDRDKVRFAMAVFDGIVREVYNIVGWFPAGTTLNSRGVHNVKRRWEFVGNVAEDKIRRAYVGHSVQHYFTAGSQNPIRYVNL